MTPQSAAQARNAANGEAPQWRDNPMVYRALSGLYRTSAAVLPGPHPRGFHIAHLGYSKEWGNGLRKRVLPLLAISDGLGAPWHANRAVPAALGAASPTPPPTDRQVELRSVTDSHRADPVRRGWIARAEDWERSMVRWFAGLRLARIARQKKLDGRLLCPLRNG